MKKTVIYFILMFMAQLTAFKRDPLPLRYSQNENTGTCSQIKHISVFFISFSGELFFLKQVPLHLTVQEDSGQACCAVSQRYSDPQF